jgi:tetratricopeptide (TPR) repeat protein
MSPTQRIAGRFEIRDPGHDLLGQGSMGEVYRAIDTHTGELVAVKALDPGVVARDPSILERFVREGKALRQLNHPNIVRMVAAVEDGGRHYLVMEYVAGGSLQDLLDAQGALPASRVMEIALELADALTRAHHLGIIHRDLKPANVLLARDSTPRLTDFGIARVLESPRLTQTGVLVGTPDFVSPEACEGKPIDERGDIWSLGVMLYEMLTGETPFPGDTLSAKLSAILTQPVPDLVQRCPDAPAALVKLIYRMLEKDREQRIPSVRLVGAELEAIQKGRERPDPIMVKSPPSSGLPAFLERGVDIEKPVFVTRESELAQLDRLLNQALAGRGQVAFITGDPGQGKTALAREFARQAREKHPDLVTASGNCNAYTGIGDPYLPFREILELLCGDIESPWETRAISREHAIRLWQCLPLTVQALVESGRDLVDVFIIGDTLTRRLAALPAWHERGNWLPKLERLVQHKATMPADPNFQQAALFEQYSRVLQAIAHQKPLLLILDDLQWADSGSINLLFHLGKRIEGSRILILGAYRPSELALGRGGERHPLAPIVNELKRQFGEVQIELGKGSGRRFVDAFVDSEPNRLGEEFKATLARVTRGHPLGTVELLRDMQERGGLERDGEGRWVEGRELDWDALPARVEAMIAERIERLDPTQRQVLKVASVEGETFTAEVVAQVLGEEPQGILSLLSNELAKRHRLVSAQNIRQVDGRRLAIYRFQHILFQRYLLGSLDVAERSNLHQAVATVLQDLYAEGREEIAGQLARHFQEAGRNVQAADCQVQAGERAVERYAYQEAVDHYQQAQAAYEHVFGNQWDPLQRATLERKIGEALYRRGENTQALESLQQALTYLGHSLPASPWGVRLQILREFVQQIGHRLLPGLFLKQGDEPVNQDVAELGRIYESLSGIALGINQEQFLLIALRTLNFSERSHFVPGAVLGFATLSIIADFATISRLAGYYGQKAVDLAEQIQHPSVSAVAFASWAMHLNSQGRWHEVLEYAQRGVDLQRKGVYWNMLGGAFAATTLADGHVHLGNFTQALACAQETVLLGRDSGDRLSQCAGLSRQGFAQRGLGQLEEAVDSLQQAMEISKSVPNYLVYVDSGGELGQCYVQLGELEQAFTVFEECRRASIEQNLMKSPVTTRFREGLAEAYLLAAKRADPSEKADWLKKAGRACQDALKQGKAYLPGKPRAMMLRGQYEWLRGKQTAAKKWWQRSLTLAEQMNVRYELGKTLLDMGSRLGDRSYLEKAIAILSEVGAEWDLARAREALEKMSDQA